MSPKEQNKKLSHKVSPKQNLSLKNVKFCIQKNCIWKKSWIQNCLNPNSTKTQLNLTKREIGFDMKMAIKHLKNRLNFIVFTTAAQSAAVVRMSTSLAVYVSVLDKLKLLQQENTLLSQIRHDNHAMASYFYFRFLWHFIQDFACEVNNDWNLKLNYAWSSYYCYQFQWSYSPPVCSKASTRNCYKCPSFTLGQIKHIFYHTLQMIFYKCTTANISHNIWCLFLHFATANIFQCLLFFPLKSELGKLSFYWRIKKASQIRIWNRIGQ